MYPLDPGVADIQKTLALAVVELPSSNLKQKLIRNRLYDRICTTPDCKICSEGRGGACMTSIVVYLISCSECGDEYVGQTGRPLCIRIKKPLDGKAKLCPATPLSSHRVRCHNGADFEIKITILVQEIQIVARKALEAFWIRAKNPKVNRLVCARH
ncbi:hypothetical protein ANCDUO_15956 [Ancylostoma duodenale]|uniref:Uncharacterized protein n=1 Tax=Ancylostoma duodenale TaxID=51022 RepID=A0A0C2FZ79_9BILA|nr:hypothetical protein ANCDUO_15956 [Ancylostoma duodenale]